MTTLDNIFIYRDTSTYLPNFNRFNNQHKFFTKPATLSNKPASNLSPTHEKPRMVTIKQLAELTNLSTYCIRKLCKNNEIKYIKAGVKILINYENFIAYLNREM